MSVDSFFYCALLSQIALVSHYLPARIDRRIGYVFATYPPAQYPNLYPQPIESYQRARRTYRYLNRFMLLAGLLLLAAVAVYPRSGEWDTAIVNAYFIAQVCPLVLMELWLVKYYWLMRQMDSRTERKAALRPRRLFDFVSPLALGAAAAVYVAFAAFVVYIDQFDYPWFGGYWNIAMLTAANLFYAGIVARSLYGEKRDPYQDHVDRMGQIGIVANQMVFVSIAGTLFVAQAIALASLDMRPLQPAMTSLFLQLFALVGARTLRIDRINFDVYKAQPTQGRDFAAQRGRDVGLYSGIYKYTGAGAGAGLAVGAAIGLVAGAPLTGLAVGTWIGMVLGAIVGGRLDAANGGDAAPLVG